MAEKRNIFEDVAADGPQANIPKTSLIDGDKNRSRRRIRIWLHVLLALVAVMIVVGGLTRLTDSGLSITEWKPVTGAVPPLSEAAWNEAFTKYQQTPEFRLQNSAMTVAEFKSIYWWEWAHRQLGRVIGLVWAVGFLWFLARRQIPTGWTRRLVLIGALGGLQGAIGWWMVSSGLTGRMVDVASYRLAIHLGLAFIIMGLIVWYSMLLKSGDGDLMQARRNREGGLARLATWLGLAAFLQILLGALVAGIDAGRGYIDWPWMNGEFLPSESFDYSPLWTNFFENPALVQFDHRMLGYLVFLLAGFAWWQSRKSPLRATKQAFDMVMAAVFLQAVLGIATVLYAAQVHIAITHQIGAIVVITLILRTRFAAMYPAQQSLR
jgi:heme a synthase